MASIFVRLTEVSHSQNLSSRLPVTAKPGMARYTLSGFAVEGFTTPLANVVKKVQLLGP